MFYQEVSKCTQAQMLKVTEAREDKPGFRRRDLIDSSVQTQACVCQVFEIKSWHLLSDSSSNPVPSWSLDIHSH